MRLNTIRYSYTGLSISHANCILYNVIFQKSLFALLTLFYIFICTIGRSALNNQLFYFCQVINFAKNKQNSCASLTPIFTPCQSAFSLDLLLSTGKRLIGKYFMIFYGPFLLQMFPNKFPFFPYLSRYRHFDSRIFCIYFC